MRCLKYPVKIPGFLRPDPVTILLEIEIQKIHLEIKDMENLNQFHLSYMDEFDTFGHLVFNSRSERIALNNLTLSLWLLDLIGTIDADFFFFGYFALVFRISIILFNIVNSIYLTHRFVAVATEISSKFREDFFKRKRSLLNNFQYPRFYFYGFTGFLWLYFIRDLLPNMVGCYIKTVSFIIFLQSDVEFLFFCLLYALTGLYFIYCYDTWSNLISQRLHARFKK